MHHRVDHWICFLLLCCGCAATAPSPNQQQPVRHTDAALELFQMGHAQADHGDNVRAEQYYLAAQRAGHPESQVLPSLLDVCVSSGRLRSALDYAEPYLRNHPEDFRLRHLVASIHFGLGNAARAFRELEGVLGGAPEHAPSHYLLAVIADEAFADLPTAQSYFQSYLKLEPHGTHAAEATSWLRAHAQRKRATGGKRS